MSHERSITVQFGKEFINLPTVVGGKQMSDEEAIKFSQRTGRNLGKFKTREEAVAAAKRRSDDSPRAATRRILGLEGFKRK